VGARTNDVVAVASERRKEKEHAYGLGLTKTVSVSVSSRGLNCNELFASRYRRAAEKVHDQMLLLVLGLGDVTLPVPLRRGRCCLRGRQW